MRKSLHLTGFIPTSEPQNDKHCDVSQTPANQESIEQGDRTQVSDLEEGTSRECQSASQGICQQGCQIMIAKPNPFSHHPDIIMSHVRCQMCSL